jgi:uncharacterized membrane protein
MRKTVIGHDLILILILSLSISLTVYVIPIQFLRIPLGLVYLFFAPGYSLATTLFYGRRALDNVERLIVGLGLSIATVSLIGFLLSYTPWGLTLDSILISTLALVLFNCTLTAYTRHKGSNQDASITQPNSHIINRRNTKPLDKILSALLTLSATVAAGILVYAIVVPKTGERFTEFYLLGPNGLAGDYPLEIIASEPAVLIIGVVNKEHSEVQYRIERVGNENSQQLAIFQLAHEERWEQPYSIALTEPGTHKILFLLYRDDDTDPYRSLHLWITVEEAPLNHD